MDDFVVAWILGATIAAFLGLIPASLAQKKGYSFGLWWLYGWALFIVAIVHVSLIPEKKVESENIRQMSQETKNIVKSPELKKIDELRQYKELYDEGILTSEEFEMKKRQLLGL